MIKYIQKLIGSPWSGLLPFVLGFMLAAMIGERDPLEAVLERIFPDEGAVGSAALNLSPVGLAHASNEARESRLLLLRHSSRRATIVKVLQHGSQESASVLAGSMNNRALFRTSSTVITHPVVVVEAELSPSDLMAVVSGSTHSPRAVKYSYRTDTAEADFSQASRGALFYTSNELKSLRITHYIYIFGAFLVGFSVSKSRQTTDHPGLDGPDD